jgi:hypothetical protein
MRPKIALLAASLFCVAPGHVQAAEAGNPTRKRPAAVEQEPDLSVVDAQLKAYGEWLMALQAIEAPVLAGLAQMGPEWQRTDRRSPAALRSFGERVGQLRVALNETNKAIEALPAPEFRALELPDDLRTAVIKRDQLALNAQVANLVSDLQALLGAEGLAATQQAAAEVMKSAQLIVDHQLRFTRAMLATTDKDSSSWDFGNVQLVLFRTIGRLMAPMSRWGPELMIDDPRLSADLLALADQLAVFRSGGERKLAAEMEELKIAVSDAAEAKDADLLSFLRRNQAVLELGREHIPVARDLETALRTAAARLDRQPLGLQALVDELPPFAKLKTRFEQIWVAESAALAGR